MIRKKLKLVKNKEVLDEFYCDFIISEDSRIIESNFVWFMNKKEDGTYMILIVEKSELNEIVKFRVSMLFDVEEITIELLSDYDENMLNFYKFGIMLIYKDILNKK